MVLTACSSIVPPSGSPRPPVDPGASVAPGGELAPPPLGAQLAHGFVDRVVLDGVVQPTAVSFAPDGRVFVAEKSGRILSFDQLGDSTPTVLVDLSRQVFDFWELGLLDIALAPSFPDQPYLYAAYTHDAPIGGTAPVWNDECPGGAGPESTGCETSGRVSRFEIAGDSVVGGEQVLIEDWCGQFGSHSLGTLLFDADGALYVSGGEGANPHFPDWGQHGDPANACGDPEGEGGALRSQDLLTNDDPTGLSGTVIRVDAATGAALPDNPNAGADDPHVARIIAHGLRNPFRMAFDPETGDLWVGDVGWANWDELDRMAPGSGVPNFGWPCYEGGAPREGSLRQYDELMGTLAPTARWPLDDAAAAVADPLTNVGAAARFDGTPESVLELTVPAGSGPFSFALWFSADSWQRNPQIADGGPAWEVAFDDTLFFRVRVAGVDHFASAPAPPTAQERHLLVTTYSGARQRLYIDGQAVADNAFDGGLEVGDGLELGERFSGVMDDATFFDRELSGAEVSEIWATVTGDEGAGGRQPRYAAEQVALCERLYAEPDTVEPPHSGYEIGSEVVAGDGCPTGANALSGLVFGADLRFGEPYADGLFFSDFTRRCIWYLPRIDDGLAREPVLFMRDAAGPVDLVPTPEGTLAYVDFVGGAVREIARE